MPSGTTSVSVNFTSLYYNPGSSPSSDRYDIYIALYYWLPNGPVSAGGSTYQCLDTQVRVENIGGTFSTIGSTATYDPGDSFGWDNVTLQVSPGQNGLLTANVANQCLQDLKAWGLPTNTPCQLAGIEIGTEGYQFQELDVNWYDVNLNVGPIPLSTSFTVSPSNPIVNTPVTFTSTTTGGTSPYITTWNFGDGSTGTGASVTHAYLSAGNFTVTLTVKDSGSPQQTATSQKPVKITGSLAASFVFNPSSPEVGLQITFTGSASGGTAPYGFSWAFGDGGSSSANPTAHSYSSTGSFTVTLTVRDANGATATSSQTVPVASAPSVSFNYSPTSPEAGSPVTFTSTTTGGVGPFTMIWLFGDGGTSNANPTTHTYATSGSFTANVTATDANGVKAISAKSVTVAPPLTVSFTETPSSPTTGQVVTCTAATAGGVGTVSYSWSFGDGATSTGNPVTHTYTSPASFTVSVTATDSDGVAAVSSQTLTVRSPLTASFTYTPSNPVTGQTVTFTATASGGTSPYTFSWSFGDGLSATGASVTHSYTTNGTYTVTLTTNDSGGRTATTSNTVSVGQQSQGYALVTSSDGKVFRLYSNGTSTLIGQPVTTQLRQISWKPDGSYALISGDSAVLLKYDGTSLTSIPTGVSTGLNFWTVSWKPDGSYALIGGS